MAVVQSREIGAIGLNPFGKAVAGAIAAVLANTIVYPLDLAKTKLQVQDKSELKGDELAESEYYESTLDVLRKLYGKGGPRALYSGLLGSLAGTVSTNFAYFYWYSFFRGLYVRKRSKSNQLTTATELFLGAVAGAVAQLFTIPVSVVTTRQQTSGRSFRQCGEEIWKQDGLRGLWRGLKASLVLVVNPSITYGSSSRLHSVLFNARERLSVRENFILGALSKSIATITTQPLIVAKAIQQSSEKFHSFLDVLVHLLKNGGVTSLFRGLGPQLSKGILVQGLLLAFKDKLETYIILLLLAFSRRSGARLAIQKV